MRSDDEFLSYDIRFPIILPKKHPVTKLIVKKHHEQGFHVAGTNQTLAGLSLWFWILCGREAILNGKISAWNVEEEKRNQCSR